MPYARKGRCVYRQNPDGSLGAKKGCAKTVEGAKQYLKALYANTPDAKPSSPKGGKK